MEKLRQGNWLALEQKIIKTRMDGRNLLELTTYRGIALWWFIRFRLYHSTETSQLIRSLTKNTYFILFADFLYDFFTSILCKILSRHSKVKTGEKQKIKILITTPNPQWKNIRDLTGRLKKGDAYFDSIITELKRKDYDIVTVYPLKYSISGFKTLIDKLKRQKDATHKAFNIYWSIKIWKKAYYARRHFRKIWKNISENEVFIDLLEKYQLKNELSYCFNSIFERNVKRIEMAKELVREEEPDLVLVIDEYDAFGRALMVAGKLKGIPTLAIQHGFIGPLHMGYMYSKDSISVYGSVETPYCPIPDKIAVYGPFYYDLLVKTSTFPRSSVVITGQPRYDKLALLNKLFSRERFCGKLGLDPQRKIVLVATQPLSWPMRETFIRSVLTALKHFPETQIIIKPHPNEKEDFYKNVVKKENIRVTILPSKSDTFEALYACDLLVAAFSTVITEALVLGKPAVTLNLTAEEPAPFYREVTLRVDKKEDLIPAIAKALHDHSTREKLKKDGKNFAFNHTYKQDGKATERVVNLIEQMIKERFIFPH
jgi:UDP-N-acetylglucosamine 2-epimerase